MFHLLSKTKETSALLHVITFLATNLSCATQSDGDVGLIVDVSAPQDSSGGNEASCATDLSAVRPCRDQPSGRWLHGVSQRVGLVCAVPSAYQCDVVVPRVCPPIRREMSPYEGRVGEICKRRMFIDHHI